MEELKDMVIREQLLNTLPDDVRIFVKEKKPKTSAEAGRVADYCIIVRKENAAGVEKEEEKKVSDVSRPVVGSAKNWVMWRASLGRHNPDLSGAEEAEKMPQRYRVLQLPSEGTLLL